MSYLGKQKKRKGKSFDLSGPNTEAKRRRYYPKRGY